MNLFLNIESNLLFFPLLLNINQFLQQLLLPEIMLPPGIPELSVISGLLPLLFGEVVRSLTAAAADEWGKLLHVSEYVFFFSMTVIITNEVRIESEFSFFFFFIAFLPFFHI